MTARRVIAKARLAKNPVRFAALELGSQGRVAQHDLRQFPVAVSVRHGTRDTDILLEIGAAYDPPLGVRLPTSGAILDVGGNIGLFAVVMLATLPECTVVSYEPDPANLAMLYRNRAKNPYGGRWKICPVAVSNRNGTLRFDSGGFADSRVDDEGDVAVPVVDIFGQSRAAVLKMDIEGSEWTILRDPRLDELPADLLVMEWHRHAIDGTTGDAAEAALLLAAAGYQVISSQYEQGRDHGLIWASRDRTC